MEEITNEVFKMPGLVPLFFAAVTGAGALRGRVSPILHDKPMSGASDLNEAKETEASFIRMIEEHERIINHICRTYSNTASDEEDLYQEIVYKLWKAYPDFKGKSKVSTWLYTVALRSAIRPFLRNQKVPIEFPDALPDHASEETGMEEGLDDGRHNLLHGLRDFDRAVLVLLDNGFSLKEVGTLLGVREQSLTRRLRRVRTMIKKD